MNFVEVALECVGMSMTTTGRALLVGAACLAIGLAGCGKQVSVAPRQGIHGKMTSLSYGALTGMNGTPANGVVFKRTFEDGYTVVAVNANILNQPKKTFIGWLADGAAQKHVVKLGELLSATGDARHGLQFEMKEPASDLMTVYVSSESSAAASTIGHIVAEAKLKQVR